MYVCAVGRGWVVSVAYQHIHIHASIHNAFVHAHTGGYIAVADCDA